VELPGNLTHRSALVTSWSARHLCAMRHPGILHAAHGGNTTESVVDGGMLKHMLLMSPVTGESRLMTSAGSSLLASTSVLIRESSWAL